MIMNNFKEDTYAVGKLEERWRTLLEEEIDNCVPMTFIACTAVAGMVSEFLAEESVKVVLSRGGYREEDFAANTALLFASRGGYIACEKLKINSKRMSDGGTYLVDRIPVIQELQTKRGYYTHHKTIIVVDGEGMEEEPFVSYLEMKGSLPTVWLEIKPWISWFKYEKSALRVLTAYRDVEGYKSEQAYNQLIRWGDERMIDILDSEIESFKRHAEERGLYKDAPEEFYRQSSYRKLIVSDHTIELLRRQRTIYMRNRMKYGEDFCNSNRVICKENGEPYRPKSFTRKWAKTLEKYGLRHIKLHGTRHSAISLLLSEGIPIQIVQQRAGHQDPKITLAVYSHVSKDKESLVADTLREILFVWHENL